MQLSTKVTFTKKKKTRVNNNEEKKVNKKTLLLIILRKRNRFTSLIRVRVKELLILHTCKNKKDPRSRKERKKHIT